MVGGNGDIQAGGDLQEPRLRRKTRPGPDIAPRYSANRRSASVGNATGGAPPSSVTGTMAWAASPPSGAAEQGAASLCGAYEAQQWPVSNSYASICILRVIRRAVLRRALE